MKRKNNTLSKFIFLYMYMCIVIIIFFFPFIILIMLLLLISIRFVGQNVDAHEVFGSGSWCLSIDAEWGEKV